MTAQTFTRPTLEQTQLIALLREIKWELRGIRIEFKRFNDRQEPNKKSEEQEIENENPS